MPVPSRRVLLGQRNSLLSGLVAYYPLSDVNDSYGVRALTNNGTVTFGAGKVGNAATFVAASSQYLSLADEAGLSMGDFDFSIAGWVNFTTISRQLILGKGDAGGATDEYYVILESDGKLYFHVGNGSAFGDVTGNTLGVLSSGTWYFFVAWHDSVANTVNISSNDGAVDSASYSGGSYDSALPFALGRDGSYGGLYLNGQLDEVGIWKRVLTAAERTRLYNGGNGITYPFA